MSTNITPRETPRLAPQGRRHWPVLTVDYEKVDSEAGYGDAIFMDIGQSTWDKKDFATKIWRWAYNGECWSRQGEEMPLSRALDLAILVSAAIMGKRSSLQEFDQVSEEKEALQNFLIENMQVLGPKCEELRRILQPTTPKMWDACAPNIFSFATSELSQDAMFAWLLSWGDAKYLHKDKSLHAVAQKFIRLLTGMSNLEVNSIETGRQWEHIDVWAEINANIFLAIEDKTDTTIHDEQLQRYKQVVDAEYPNKIKCFAYVKTGNEPKSILQKVQNAGYRIILRKDILKCLETYSGENALLCNYREHLKAQELATQSFRSLPVREWRWSAWEGFYKELETSDLEIDNWGYVANPSGGFLGAWWHWKDFPRGQMYLQFEQRKLCFKICPKCDKHERSEIRNEAADTLLKLASKDFSEIRRPNRFGAGEYMTIAVVEPEALFGEGQVDVRAVINKLKQYENLVDTCCLHQLR